jgi:hypothetical protein
LSCHVGAANGCAVEIKNGDASPGQADCILDQAPTCEIT